MPPGQSAVSLGLRQPLYVHQCRHTPELKVSGDHGPLQFARQGDGKAVTAADGLSLNWSRLAPFVNETTM
jgi:hypothetical protein